MKKKKTPSPGDWEDATEYALAPGIKVARKGVVLDAKKVFVNIGGRRILLAKALEKIGLATTSQTADDGRAAPAAIAPHSHAPK
jgi:hypothetical protein